MGDALVRNISDTARWAALYRANETDRPDALYRDPLARRLAGERGEQIAASMPMSESTTWAWVLRTVLFDRVILGAIERGTDMVVNLAAGLDARPYRLPLPATLQWIEVDLPPLLDEKSAILKDEKPVCTLERVGLDLSDDAARRTLFADLGRRARNVLIVTEGLLIYLAREEVGVLASDLAGPASFRSWAIDIASPGLVAMLQKHLGPNLASAGELRFGPEEGPNFYVPYGWRPREIHSILKTAAKLGRLSFFLRLMALLPESHGKQGKRPWSAVCLMERTGS